MKLHIALVEKLFSNSNLLTPEHKEKFKEKMNRAWENNATEFVFEVIKVIPDDKIQNFLSTDLLEKMVNAIRFNTANEEILGAIEKIWKIATPLEKKALIGKIEEWLRKIESNPSYTQKDDEVIRFLKLLKLEDLPEDRREQFLRLLQTRTNILIKVNKLEYLVESLRFIPSDSAAKSISDLINSKRNLNEIHNNFIKFMSADHLKEAGKWESVKNSIKALTSKAGERLKRELYRKFTPQDFLRYWDIYLDKDILWDIKLVYQILIDYEKEEKLSQDEVLNVLSRIINECLISFLGDEKAHSLIFEVLNKLYEANRGKLASSIIAIIGKLESQLIDPTKPILFAKGLFESLSTNWAEIKELPSLQAKLDSPNLKSIILELFKTTPLEGIPLFAAYASCLNKIDEIMKEAIVFLQIKVTTAGDVSEYLGFSDILSKFPNIASQFASEIKALCEKLLPLHRKPKEKLMGIRMASMRGIRSREIEDFLSALVDRETDNQIKEEARKLLEKFEKESLF